MFCFAYDGSIGGDWVSHYALRLASHHPDKTLHVVHVRERTVSPESIDEKLAHMGQEGERIGVGLQVHVHARDSGIADAIGAFVPQRPDTFLICGTRVQGSKRGFLSGTVSEQLLQAGGRNVLAVRVVQPGILGLPRSFLLPVSGHPRGIRAALPLLRHFAPDIARLHVLFVRRVNPVRFRLLSHEDAERLRGPGQAYCDRVEQELADEVGVAAAIMDANVIVSDDVPKEIVLYANRVKSRLTFLGASERTLAQRMLYGNPIEQVLRDTTCDVAVYRGAE